MPEAGAVIQSILCPQVFLALGELLLSCNWAVVADILLVGMGYMLVLALLSSLGIGKDFRDHGVGVKVTFHSLYTQNTHKCFLYHSCT